MVKIISSPDLLTCFCFKSPKVPCQGIEPRVRSFEDCDAIRHTHTACKHLDLGSNQDLGSRRAPCGPRSHRDVGPTTGFAPASSAYFKKTAKTGVLLASSHVGMEDRM